MKNPLDTVRGICGTQSAIAERFGIFPQAVQQWKFIPETRALEAEKLFKGKVTAREILEYAAKARAEQKAA